MRRFSQLAIPYAVWVALMILLPMLLILLYAFTTQGNDIVNFSFTLDHFIRFFTDQDFLLILWRSLVIAFKTTIICVLLGYPIAYFIAQQLGQGAKHPRAGDHAADVDQHAGAHVCVDRHSL